MFEEIITKLLGLKANLQTEKERKIAEVILAVENEFAENEAKIDKMLDECGYVAPIIEPAEECYDTTDCETMNNQENYI